MSGIAGIIKLDKGKDISIEEFTTFFSPILVNRSNEKEIADLKGYGFIGVAELTGKTPKVFLSHDGSLQLFVWGEIFIKDSYLNSAQERYNAVMDLWQQGEQQFFHQISGDHVALIFERASRRIILFNSLFGMMPLYYSIQGEKLLFSSRLQSFLGYKKQKYQVNRTAILEHLIFNFSIHNNTFLEDVFLLPAASNIVVHRGGIEIKKYSNHNFLLQDRTFNYVEGEKLVNDVFAKATHKIASIDSKMGCAITGGWDGRLVLSYLTKEADKEIVLYTYGKQSHIDMKVAKDLAKKFGYPHLSVSLDEKFVDNYEQLASKSVLLSDGMRALNRGHYILMAQKVSEVVDVVISGNCGSNILKIVQSPGPFYNEYTLSLFKENNSLSDKAVNILNSFFEKNPWIIKSEFSVDEFIHSVEGSELVQTEDYDSGKRFYHFLLTNIERKYFGAEASAYASFIYNYSPFIDADFIKTIIQTPYYGGHYSFLERNPLVRAHLTKLYATLMYNNHKGLARFTSDRGFPITWFTTPVGRLTVFIKRTFIDKLSQNADMDGFNHRKGFAQIKGQWELNPTFFDSNELPPYGETLSRAFTISHWYKNALSK